MAKKKPTSESTPVVKARADLIISNSDLINLLVEQHVAFIWGHSQ